MAQCEENHPITLERCVKEKDHEGDHKAPSVRCDAYNPAGHRCALPEGHEGAHASKLKLEDRDEQHRAAPGVFQ